MKPQSFATVASARELPRTRSQLGAWIPNHGATNYPPNRLLQARAARALPKQATRRPAQA